MGNLARAEIMGLYPEGSGSSQGSLLISYGNRLYVKLKYTRGKYTGGLQSLQGRLQSQPWRLTGFLGDRQLQRAKKELSAVVSQQEESGQDTRLSAVFLYSHRMSMIQSLEG